MINLFAIKLFQDLTSIQNGNLTFDLHNEFLCTSCRYEQESKRLKLYFKSSMNSDILQKDVYIIFNGANITKLDLCLDNTIDSGILNNFYRGRYETSEGLVEYSQYNEAYFYLEFENGYKFEILAQEVLFFEKDN